mgnify:CR=1 FL=1
MHRHGYRGRKFGRETDARTALLKGLADSLILQGSIETTLPKAKELRPYLEKMISKAKQGGLHNRRQIISGVATLEAAHKLIDDIAPKLSRRSSGYLRIKRTNLRRGDAAQMAQISFVDDLASKSTTKQQPVSKRSKAVTKKAIPAKAKPWRLTKLNPEK